VARELGREMVRSRLMAPAEKERGAVAASIWRLESDPCYPRGSELQEMSEKRTKPESGRNLRA
jgi:hypothetical protein